MSNAFTYEWPGRVVMGAGTAAQTGTQAQSLGIRHAFVVVDPGILPLAEPIVQSLTAAGIAHTLFSEVIGNPDVAHTDSAGAAYRASGADGIIGLGGGSALDMAKGVRLLAGVAAEHSCAEYMSTRADRRPAPPAHTLPPMLAIPTTAGTGSEVTPWGVVTDHDTQQKAGIGGVSLIPNVAIADPELTVGLPPFLTAATGMDALSHLIEAYVSTNINPLLDGLILHGIRLVAENLATAVANPTHLPARQAMMEAAVLGGIAISSNWLGGCHSLAHQLSTFANMHHGLACAIMLPPQMAFSAPAAPERYAHIAAALRPGAIDAEDAAELVAELNAAVGLPSRLSQAGVTAELIPTLAAFAIKDLNWTTNPRPMTEADMAALYTATL